MGIGPHTSGPTSHRHDGVTASAFDKSDEELLAIFEPMMDNCLRGSTERDHAMHVRDFTERLRAIVTPENLAAQCEAGQATHGFFARRELVGIFRREERVGVVWRQFFTRAEGEFVNHAIFVERNGRILIDHCLIC